MDPIGIINWFVLNTSNPSVYATQWLGKFEKYTQKRPIPWGLITRFARNLAGLKSFETGKGSYDSKPKNKLSQRENPSK